MVVPEPYYFFSPPILARNTGPYTTTHGTPHDYDTHVPLLVYGPGIRQGIRKDLVQPQAAAAIIAHSLGIQPPGGAVVKTPKELFQE